MAPSPAWASGAAFPEGRLRRPEDTSAPGWIPKSLPTQSVAASLEPPPDRCVSRNIFRRQILTPALRKGGKSAKREETDNPEIGRSHMTEEDLKVKHGAPRDEASAAPPSHAAPTCSHRGLLGCRGRPRASGPRALPRSYSAFHVVRAARMDGANAKATAHDLRRSPSFREEGRRARGTERPSEATRTLVSAPRGRRLFRALAARPRALLSDVLRG